MPVESSWVAPKISSGERRRCGEINQGRAVPLSYHDSSIKIALTKVEAASFFCPFAPRPVTVESFLAAKVSIGERARRSGGHVTLTVGYGDPARGQAREL